jgi:hypothetical protein
MQYTDPPLFVTVVYFKYLRYALHGIQVRTVTSKKNSLQFIDLLTDRNNWNDAVQNQIHALCLAVSVLHAPSLVLCSTR